MSQVKAVPEARVALGVALTVGLLATAVAALPISSTADPEPAPVIAPADSVGINVLEPPGQSTRTVPPAPAGPVERQVQNWVPTGHGGGNGGNGNGGGNGGGNGVHGSPKG